MPFFTIVIPVLNKVLEVEKALHSILNQSFDDVEILVFDGGSTDGTLDVLRSILDPRITLSSKKDNGVYDAMNQGIEKSNGDWIYFLGADDYLYNDQVLYKIWTICRTSKEPIIYGNVSIKGNQGWAKGGEIYAGSFSKNRMLVKSICHQAIFYDRKFILRNSLSFDEKYFVSADWQFNLRCRRLTKFKYVDLIIAVFQAGGISTTKSDSFQEQIKIEFNDLFPSKLEIVLKSLIKQFIFYVKKNF